MKTALNSIEKGVNVDEFGEILISVGAEVSGRVVRFMGAEYRWFNKVYNNHEPGSGGVVLHRSVLRGRPGSLALIVNSMKRISYDSSLDDSEDYTKGVRAKTVLYQDDPLGRRVLMAIQGRDSRLPFKFL